MQLGTFFEKEQGKTYICNEGNYTVATGISTISGKTEVYGTFATPIKAEGFVEFDLGENKEMQIKAAATGSTVRYITQYEPELPAGKIPQANKTDYRRAVTAFRLPSGELELPLAASNSAIVAGDSITVVSANGGVDKDSNAGEASESGKVIALESKAANSADPYILCEIKAGEIDVE